MPSIRASTDEVLLDVADLQVTFETRKGPLVALDGVSFQVGRGEILGMVGESGAGKSLTGVTITGLLPPGSRVTGGAVRFEGRNLLDLDAESMRRLRGRSIGTIFQDPLTSLNPLFTIGDQLAETIQVHLGLSRSEARRRAVRWLVEVGLPDAETRYGSYPHEFSGGMRQRVVIALALCAEPRLVIADEPTTALDVSVQAQIIQLLKRLARDHGTSVLLITHDMGVIAEITDRVAVLYLGRVVETGATRDVLASPAHPYTIGLTASIPRIGKRPARLPQIEGTMPRLSAAPWTGCAFRQRCPDAMAECAATAPAVYRVGDTRVACKLAASGRTPTPARTLVEFPQIRPAGGRFQPPEPHLVVESLSRHFDLLSPLLDRFFERAGPRVVRAVDDVSFYIRKAQTFALVGESGCGKSTVARLITCLQAPTAGMIAFDSVPLTPFAGRQDQRAALLTVQMVFQDPYSSLDPRWRVGSIIAEPMRAAGRASRAAMRDRVAELLQSVGLSPDDARRFPHQFSGGQRQRISIARALAGDPTLLVCDEPTSALDVSVQAQILNLLKDLQQRRRLTMLFISHDLAVVDFISDVVGVMYLGRLCEIAETRTLFARPLHPYTRMLRDSLPDLEMAGRQRKPVPGEVPSPLTPPPGCRFHTRCPHADRRCRSETPTMRDYQGSWAACHALEDGRIEVPPAPSTEPIGRPLPHPGELSFAEVGRGSAGRRWRPW